MAAKRAFFRVDGGRAIGGGHLMRCLTLASELKSRGWETCFVASDSSRAFLSPVVASAQAIQLIDGLENSDPEKEFEPCDQELDASRTLERLQEGNADLMVLDHYQLGAAWERSVRPRVSLLMVIDDLGREHECDLLLDQNYHEDPDSRYACSAQGGAKLLLGPRYALLRRQFESVRRQHSEGGIVRRLFVSFGATDPTGETAKVLRALLSMPGRRFTTDVLVDPLCLPAEVAARASQEPDIQILPWTDDVATVMARCDLAIGAGGISAWERCAAGLPALVIVVAANQRTSMEALARQGAIRLIGDQSVTVDDIRRQLTSLLCEPQRLIEMSTRASSIVPPGKSGARAVVEELESLAC